MPERQGPEHGADDVPARAGSERVGSARSVDSAQAEPGRVDSQEALMQRLVDLSIQRSQMSAERSYMNAERTLSVWLRTALAVMVVGIAIDRFRLFLLEGHTMHTGQDAASQWVGAGLVAFGVIMVVVLAVRFQLYAAAYCRTYKVPRYHGPFVAPAFAVIMAAFGVVLVILLLVDS